MSYISTEEASAVRILQGLTSLVGLGLVVTLLATYFGFGSDAVEGLRSWFFNAESTMREWFSSLHL